LAALRKNLSIINQVVDKTNNDTAALCSQVRSDIYPKIDAYSGTSRFSSVIFVFCFLPSLVADFRQMMRRM
jgi:hypothetical protein